MLKYLFLVAIVSYQGHLAHANSFVQKPVLIGDNVISILRDNGFTETQRDAILSQSKELRQLFLTLDTKYLVQVERTPGQESVELKLYDSQSNAAFRVWRNRKDYGVQPFVPQYKTNIMHVDGHIYGSIMSSLYAKVPSNWVASRFIDAYIFDVKPNDLARGAKFSFTVEKKYDQNFLIKYGEILNTTLEVNGRLITKKFVRSKTGGVFITDQDLMNRNLYYAPVDYLRFASLFQPNRRHPITKRLQPHLGVDFELAEGQSVFAARKGTVVRLGKNHAAGNFVVLRHADGVETSYNHMRTLSPEVHIGLNMALGQKVGEVGCTGYCTRPHLHFAMKIRGRMVNPLKYIKPYSSGIEPLLIERVAKN